MNVVSTSFDERERAVLAPFAMHSRDSRGRRHPEPPHPYRGPFQRDRDRVLHSSAFRRLSGKTQVFTGEDLGDYHRTRLTHTHEVASIARTIGRALRLNEDLIEALALFHDIGHPPYGHAGEDALDEVLAPHGGFSHNRYALTLAEELEDRYPEFPGLNLSLEVLESQEARIDKSAPGLQPLLEAQVVDAADSITYDAHDTDDAIKLGLVSLNEFAEVPLVRRVWRQIRARYTALSEKHLRQQVVHELIDVQAGNVLNHAQQRLGRAGWSDAQQARHSDWRIGPDPELSAGKGELERFLYDRVYRHPEVVRQRHAAQDRLKALFRMLVQRASLLPARFQRRAAKVGLPRAVGEYLAGMTDRYCERQYRWLSGEFPGE